MHFIGLFQSVYLAPSIHPVALKLWGLSIRGFNSEKWIEMRLGGFCFNIPDINGLISDWGIWLEQNMQGKIDDRDDKEQEQSQDSGSTVSRVTVAHNASLRNGFVDMKNFDSNQKTANSLKKTIYVHSQYPYLWWFSRRPLQRMHVYLAIGYFNKQCQVWELWVSCTFVFYEVLL